MRRSILGLLAVCLSLLAAPAWAEPSLWVVKGEGGTLYLFGTVHLLPPGLAWRSPGFERAFRESTDIWTEVPVPVNAQGTVDPEAILRVRRMTLELGMQSGPPLSSRLTAEEAAAMRTIAAQGGVPAASLERMRPWLAATMLTGANNNRLGWSARAGADVTITAEAKAAGKAFHAFETEDQQMHLLPDLPPDVELAYLRQTIAQSKDVASRFATLARLWSEGKDDEMEALVNGSVRAASPELYERIVVARNQAWLPTVVELTKTPGVKFVAVGDGHLVGRDGLVALLRARGVRVERVER